MKKILLLSALFLLPLLTMAESAVDAGKIGDCYYYVWKSEHTATAYGFSSDGTDTVSGDITIPGTIVFEGENYNVTRTGWESFKDCKNITSVTIEEGMETIEYGSFTYCTGMTSISLPTSLRSLGQMAFGFSGLTSLTIPEGITKLESGIAYTCNLTALSLPSTLTTLTEGALSYIYTLEEMTIPAGVDSIGARVFANSYDLKTIYIKGNVTKIDPHAFISASEALEKIYVPQGTLANYANVVENKDKIEEVQPIAYNLRICGTRINSDNCADIAAFATGVTGTVSYDPDNTILTLTNATLTTPDVTQAIWNTGIDGLKIVVNGTCDLNTPYCIALRLDANTTIVGTNPATDTLKVRNAGPLDQPVGSTPAGTCYIALATFDNAALTVNNCTVETEGAGGILLQDSSQMTINHARVTARSIGTPSGSAQRKVMRSFKGTLEPILIDCELIAPEGVYFDATLGGYTADGSELTRARVVIEPTEPEPEQKWENGVLPGKFTVAFNKQVTFSQGNLQYKASTDTWRFAANQCDTIGADNANISATYNGWISLLGWGTGNNPTLATEEYDDYQTFTDWGTNPISNGGNAANAWRTLTTDEWAYIYRGRSNADNLWGLATVNGVHGFIFLPDNWTTPSGLSFTAKTKNWRSNQYSLDDWSQMETAGAVFLPAEGMREGTTIYAVGSSGLYWSSTPSNDYYPYTFRFAEYGINPQYASMNECYKGQSVRLVQDVAVELPTYYVAGNGSTANPWCDGLYWDEDGSPMTNGAITFHDVPAGIYEFKITDGQLGEGHEWAYGALDTVCSSPNVQNGGTDDNGNIRLYTSDTQDITIMFDGTRICVTGTFVIPTPVEITSYTIVGDLLLVGSSWNLDDENNNMTETTTGIWTLTKYGVTLIANANYGYKVVGNHSYSVFQFPSGDGHNMVNEPEGGKYDIVFTYDTNACTLTHVATKLTGVENTRADEIQSQKIIRDGQLLILRNGKTYTAQGALVNE